MRKVYIELLKLLGRQAQLTEEVRADIAELLLLLNSETAPALDQDIRDAFSEFYIFLVFGPNSERTNMAGALPDWSSFWFLVEQLEAVS